MNRIETLAVLLLALLSSSCINEKSDSWEIASGSRIPGFEVAMNDGTMISSDDLGNCVSVIFFFHTGCPDCRRTLPEVQRTYDMYSDAGVVFVPVSRAERGAEVAGYWDEAGLSMPYSAQEDRTVYELFAKSRIPRVYMCRNGKIVRFYTDSPTPTYENLVSDIRQLMAE